MTSINYFSMKSVQKHTAQFEKIIEYLFPHDSKYLVSFLPKFSSSLIL